MPLCQLLLTSAGTISVPLVIRTNLYGKYKIAIHGIWSNVAVTAPVSINSRQFMLPFSGSIGATTGATVGTLASQSTRYPMFLINTSGSIQYNHGYAPLSFYSDLDGSFEIVLIDMITQVPLVMASNTVVVLNLDIEPVDTALQAQTHGTTQNLAHTFTQLPVSTYSPTVRVVGTK